MNPVVLLVQQLVLTPTYEGEPTLVYCGGKTLLNQVVRFEGQNYRLLRVCDVFDLLNIGAFGYYGRRASAINARCDKFVAAETEEPTTIACPEQPQRDGDARVLMFEMFAQPHMEALAMPQDDAEFDALYRAEERRVRQAKVRAR